MDRFNDPSVSVSLETMCKILGLYTDCEACNDKIQNQIYTLLIAMEILVNLVYIRMLQCISVHYS